MAYRWHIGGPNPCKACLERDGQIFEGEFEPLHPNCTCWPEQVSDWEATVASVNEFAEEMSKSRDVPLWTGSSQGPKIAFVAASPSQYDAARRVPITGAEGSGFKRAVLEPLGLRKSEVGITYLVPRLLKARGHCRPPKAEEVKRHMPGLLKDLQAIQPDIIITLGKQAAEAMGPRADFALPHPGALANPAIEKEVSRKVRKIRKTMKEGFYPRKSFLLPERRSTKLLKAPTEVADDQHLVYCVVLEPGTPDGEGDVFSAELIEQLAHEYCSGLFRQFQNWHSGQEVQALLVESEIAKTDYDWMGQSVKKGSWVICVKILSEYIWRLIRAGIYQGISVGGEYVRVQRA